MFTVHQLGAENIMWQVKRCRAERKAKSRALAHTRHQIHNSTSLIKHYITQEGLVDSCLTDHIQYATLHHSCAFQSSFSGPFMRPRKKKLNCRQCCSPSGRHNSDFYFPQNCHQLFKCPKYNTGDCGPKIIKNVSMSVCCQCLGEVRPTFKNSKDSNA